MLLMISPGLALEEDEEPTVFESPLEPSPSESEFTDECAKLIDPDCGEAIFSGIFSVDDVVLTNHCCFQLMAMGKTCHDEIVKKILEIPEFKPEATTAWVRSGRIWNQCDSGAGDFDGEDEGDEAFSPSS